MFNQIISGIISNWYIVLFSFIILIGGSIEAYRRHGLKRLLLGKRNDHRSLIYRRGDGSVVWSDTLKTWQIIFTGGMSILTLFLLFMLLVLAFIYQHDIQAVRNNDRLLCDLFGTIDPTEEQVYDYYGNNFPSPNLTKLTLIGDGRRTGNS